MNRKNILIVSRWFYPRISPRSFRTTELAKEFANRGHNVVVMFPTEGFDYSEFEKEHGLSIRDIGTPHPWENCLQGKGLFNYYRKCIRKAAAILFLFPSIQISFLVAKALKHDKDYDLLLSIASPHTVHFGVALALKNNRRICKAWVADSGDPFMGAVGIYPKMFYFKYLEKYYCKKADYLTVPIEEAKDGYFPEFRHKIRVIPQGYDLNEIDIYQEEVKNEVPTFAYAGNFVRKVRDPKPFLEYLTTLSDSFIFVLYTSNVEYIKPFLGVLNGKIELREKIPRKKLIYELSKMDFLINFQNESSVQQPSKLIDYALTGRPILSIRSNDLDTTVFREFLGKNYNNRMEIDDLDRYNIITVAKQFLSLIEKDSESV